MTDSGADLSPHGGNEPRTCVGHSAFGECQRATKFTVDGYPTCGVHVGWVLNNYTVAGDKVTVVRVHPGRVDS